MGIRCVATTLVKARSVVGGVEVHEAFASLVADLVPDLFPSRDDVESVGALLLPGLGCRSGVGFVGQTFHLGITPGTVSLRTVRVDSFDLVGVDRCDARDAVEAVIESASVRGDGPGSRILRGPRTFGWSVLADKRRMVEDVLSGEVRPRMIRDFSADSRRRMVRTLAELDYSRWSDDGGTLGMVTLTLPGWWEILAPDGQAFKHLIDLFRHRWLDEVGMPWRCLWKMEFQRRGAPHQHMLIRVPSLVGRLTFEEWLSLTWAEVCADSLSPRDRAAYDMLGEADRHVSAGTGVDFSAGRFTDPRRTAIYFLKHSTKASGDKEYQHTVPGLWNAHGVSVGRFWGFCGLERVSVEIEIDHARFIRARRILRHVARARSSAVVIRRAESLAARVAPARGRCRCAEGVPCELRSSCRPDLTVMRRERRRGGFGSAGGGWVLVNDALRLALDLGRALALE